MLIPSLGEALTLFLASLSRRVNANSQLVTAVVIAITKLIKKGEC